MATLIDNTYFTGSIAIAQKSQAEVAANLTAYIMQYEPEYLQKVLGYSFYKDFIAGLEEDPVPQKWADLLNGADFTSLDGKLKHWAGFVAGEGASKLSPIANYVYWQFRMYNSTLTTGTGENVSMNENSVQISPARKMCDAWNTMVNTNWVLWEFLFVNKDTYDLDGSDFVIFNSCGYALRGAAWGDMAYKVNDFDL